jgi:chitodextrinase
VNMSFPIRRRRSTRARGAAALVALVALSLGVVAQGGALSAAAATPAGTVIADPAFSSYEQGTIASDSGLERDGASDVATRIRLTQPVAVDPSWQGLQFDGGVNGADINVTIFAYDANGKFLTPSTGWKSLAHPYLYSIPSGAVSMDYAIMYTSAAKISTTDRTPWVTISDVQPDPNHAFQLTTQTIAPEFTIPGISGGSQGGNFVDGNLWTANASDDGNGAANGSVLIYSIDYANKKAALIHKFSHNFGHLNSFSYDKPSGQLIFGNGSSSYTQPPQFFVLKVSDLDLDGTNTLASAKATTFDVPADFGAKSNVIWTDRPNVAVMLTNDGTDIRTIKLETGSDQGQYGDYQQASDGEYNGTFDVLDSYFIDSAYDVVQSSAWVQGKLVIGLGHGPMSVGVISLGDNGQMIYDVRRDAAQPNYFETFFGDTDNGYFGGVNVQTGVGYFWHAANLSFTATPPPATVTGVAVSPATATVTAGATLTFGATVSGDNDPDQSVTWGVSGNQGTGTSIDGAGVLTVASDEAASRLTVTATSTVDPSKSGSATVSITPAAPTLSFVTPGDGASLAGTVPVSVSVTGAGLQAYNLRVDSAGLQYAYQPAAGEQTFQLDTTTLSNGVHTLLATATNAEGGKTTITEKITVDNPVLPAGWVSSAIYNSGQQVSYKGSAWEALWWTQNQTPGDPNGPWEQIATAPDGTALWTASRIFLAGDKAEYHGVTYQAQWWTRNQAPGDANGPWKVAN